jgi:hypothetical protein
LGKDWPTKTSRDPATIRTWFTDTDYGVFIHLGRSGAVAFDVDAPEHLPPVLVEAIRSEQPPHQPTRPKQPGRGHYVFAVPPGRKFGNGMGKLKTKEKWGEVRGTNGIIVAFPSVHENPDGCYGPWVRSGPIPVLPDSGADLLPDRTKNKARAEASDGDEDGSDAATDTEVESFLESQTGNERPDLLGGVEHRFSEKVTQGSRHEAAVSALCWAMREAAVGLYPAQRAAKRLGDMFIKAMAESRNGSDRILNRIEAASEFDGILAWAIGQVHDADLEEVRRSALARTPKLRRLRRPFEPTSDAEDEGDGSEDDQSDPHDQGSKEEEIKDPSRIEVDLSEVLRGLRDGTIERPKPTIGVCSDGEALFYAKAVNGLHGDSGDGKSFVAQLTAYQEIGLGHHVVYIDLESDRISVTARMLALGLKAKQIETYFHYWHPDGPYGVAAEDRLMRFVIRVKPTLVIIDSVGVAVALEEVDPDNDIEYLAWAILLPRPIAECGPGVLLIDHSKKARGSLEERLFPSGTQRKRAVITGASYLVEMVKNRPMAQGQVGAAHLYTAKTKEGHYPRASVAATFVLDSTTEVLEASLDAPEPFMRPEGGGFRPTKKLEMISLHVEANPDLTKATVEKTVGGDTKITRACFDILITEGYFAPLDPRHGQAHRLRSLKPYREADDPKAGVSQGIFTTHAADDDLDDDKDE